MDHDSEFHLKPRNFDLNQVEPMPAARNLRRLTPRRVPSGLPVDDTRR